MFICVYVRCTTELIIKGCSKWCIIKFCLLSAKIFSNKENFVQHLRLMLSVQISILIIWKGLYLNWHWFLQLKRFISFSMFDTLIFLQLCYQILLFLTDLRINGPNLLFKIVYSPTASVYGGFYFSNIFIFVYKIVICFNKG